MKPLLHRVRRIAEHPGDYSILVTGETGTGKEILVQHIASLMGKKFVAQNMAAIQSEMAESELFGHMKGAFTSAVSNKLGLIEQAHNGIFFLDELGECSLSIQTKLLRVIETGELTPVGATVPKRLNVRFIGATNRDLELMVKEKTFREDLYQRLNTFVLHIPPLRDRPEDIILYTNHFINKYAGKRNISLTQCGIDALMSFGWGGNVRQLEHIIDRIIILSENGVIDEAIVNEQLKTTSGKNEELTGVVPLQHSRSEIMIALKEEGGNRSKTAARFGVNTSTLWRWMKRFGISDFIEAQPGRPSLMKCAHELKEETV